MYDKKREKLYDNWLTDIDKYLDEQWQRQDEEERQQWEEENDNAH